MREKSLNFVDSTSFGHKISEEFWVLDSSKHLASEFKVFLPVLELSTEDPVHTKVFTVGEINQTSSVETHKSGLWKTQM